MSLSVSTNLNDYDVRHCADHTFDFHPWFPQSFYSNGGNRTHLYPLPRLSYWSWIHWEEPGFMYHSRVNFTCLGSDSIDFACNDGESHFNCDNIWYQATCWHLHSYFGRWSLCWSSYRHWDKMASNKVSRYGAIQTM